MPARIRKGDMVAVVAGDDRGKRGRVLKILPAKNRVIVEGVNLVYKHLRRSQQNPQGGRIHREAPVHMSNVMPVDPETNEATRVSMGEGRTRIGRRSGTPLDVVKAKGGKAKGAKTESEN